MVSGICLLNSTDLHLAQVGLVFKEVLVFFIFRNEKGTCAAVFGIRGYEHWLKVYVIYFGFVAWLIPSILAGVFYYFVCTTVWKSKVTVARLPSYLSEKCDRRVSEPTREYVNGLREKSLGLRNQTSEFDRKRIQTVRLTLTIIVCNFLLWAPYCCMNALNAYIPSLGRTCRFIPIVSNLKLDCYIVTTFTNNFTLNPYILKFNTSFPVFQRTSYFHICIQYAIFGILNL